MKKSDRYRVAIIGCGKIAQTGHLPAVLGHPRFELRGLCDIRPDRIEAMLKICRERQPGADRDILKAADYRSLIAKGSFDACILALHPEHSVNIAMDLLRKGMPVLDEKPLAVTIEDGLRLAEVIDETRGVYQIGFCFRYCRLIRDAAEWTRSIGAPCLYQVSIYDEQPSQHDLDAQAMIQGILRRSSAITHEGSHVIDWMSALNPAPIQSVMARAVKTSATYAGPNIWVCQFALSDGSILQLTVGWLLENQPPSSLRVAGPEGLLELDLFRGTGRLAIGAKNGPVRAHPLRQEFSIQLDAFAGAIEHGAATTATVRDGLRALRATLACEKSFAENTVVAI